MIKFSDKPADDYPDYLNDESHLINSGKADRIYFPKVENEIVEIVKLSKEKKIPITISGGGTGISGGRVPLEGWIIATDDMTTIVSDQKESWTDPETNISYEVHLNKLSESNAELTIPIAMTVKSIQNFCRENDWFYPPDPTERSSFIGGNINTNASGARSFKFGSTRNWVQKLRIILPNGNILKLDRSNNKTGEINKESILIKNNNEIIYNLPRPTYKLPNTRKNVAGPVINDESQLIDLFIGSDGIFGIVSEVTLKLIKEPFQIISIFVFLNDLKQVTNLIEESAKNRDNNQNPVPLSVEYLDNRSLDIIRKEDSTVPPDAKYLLIIEQDLDSQEQMDEYLEYWSNKFDSLNIRETSVALDYKEIEHHKFLRHLIPETINTIVKNNGQGKLGTDYSVPIRSLEKFLSLAMSKGDEFEKYLSKKYLKLNSIGYAIWAHAGDAHLHLNLLPKDDDDTKVAKKIFVEIMRKIVEWDGSIAAEHGLGKKYFEGKPGLYYQYGENGINQVKKIKEILDPNNLLNRGNLIGYD